MKFSVVSALAYLSYVAAAPIPEDTAVLRRSGVPGVLPFELGRISSVGMGLSKRDKYMSYQTKIENNDDEFYTLDLGVGYPQKNYKFTIDTTSPLTWIGNNTDITSDPYFFNGDTSLVSNAQRSSYTYYDGSYVNYTSSVTQIKARKTVRNVPFGIAYKVGNIDYLNHTSGYVGLGHGSDVLHLLKDQGYINRTGFALSMYNDRSTGANIMFGGVDHGKYSGKLWVSPREDPAGVPSSGKFNGLRVNSISIGSNTKDIKSNVLIDAQSPFTYVPQDIYDALVDYYSVDTSSETVGKYGNPVFDIQKHGNKEVSLNVAGAEIKMKGETIGMPVVSLAHGVKKPRHLRVFGFKPNSAHKNINVLGVSVLQSMYVVFDYDADRVLFAQIDTNPGSTKLMPISDNVKYSKTAPDYQ